MTVKVGDVVKRRPEFLKTETGVKGRVEDAYGRVVYVHPAGRYHTVEFETSTGIVRESFCGVQK